MTVLAVIANLKQLNMNHLNIYMDLPKRFYMVTHTYTSTQITIHRENIQLQYLPENVDK